MQSVYIYLFFSLSEESAATQQEINSIDNKLKELRIKKAELQKNCNNIVDAKNERTKNGEHKLLFRLTNSEFFMLEARH